MKRTIRLLFGAGLAMLLAGATLTGTALADPRDGGAAGCMGYEAADDSPPGSLTGASNQYGMSGVMNIGIQGAVDAGIFENRGAFIKLIAHNSLGSHEACDEALGLDPDEE